MANKFYNSLRDENGEPTYSYNNEDMRHFVRNTIKGGRCTVLIQCYKSSISDEVFNIFSTELNKSGNICEITDKYFEFTNKHRKSKEKEFDSKFEDYRDIIQEEKSKYVSDKLSRLKIHEKLPIKS